MARPVRTALAHTWQRWHQLGRWARPAQGDPSLVGKRREGARQTYRPPGRSLLHRHREAVAAQVGPIGADRPEYRVEADARQERRATVHLEVGRPRSTWRGREVAQRQPARRHRANPIGVEVDRAGHREGGVWRRAVDVDRHLDGKRALVLGGGSDQDVAGPLAGDRGQGAVEAGICLSGSGHDDRGQGGNDREES
jgi:hypothetical protein